MNIMSGLEILIEQLVVMKIPSDKFFLIWFYSMWQVLFSM